MMDTVGLRISDGPLGYVRTETWTGGVEQSSVRYVERRDGSKEPGIMQLDRQQGEPLFESGGVSVSIRAYKGRIEVVIAVRKETLDAARAA